MTTREWTAHRIAGAYYHKDQNKRGFAYVKDRLEGGGDIVPHYLVLERDPNNRYDKNAIAVRDDRYGELIGWVPKEENLQLAMMMDKLGVKFTGVLSRAGTSFQNSKLYMRIYLTEKEPTFTGTVTTPAPATEALGTLGNMFYDYELNV